MKKLHLFTKLSFGPFLKYKVNPLCLFHSHSPSICSRTARHPDCWSTGSVICSHQLKFKLITHSWTSITLQNTPSVAIFSRRKEKCVDRERKWGRGGRPAVFMCVARVRGWLRFIASFNTPLPSVHTCTATEDWLHFFCRAGIFSQWSDLWQSYRLHKEYI